MDRSKIASYYRETPEDLLPMAQISAETFIKHYRRFLIHGEFEEAINLRHSLYASHKVTAEQWENVDSEIRRWIHAGIDLYEGRIPE